MEEKIYTMGDIEELYGKLDDLFDGDYEKIEELISDKGCGNESSYFGEVMAGGLPEEKVCTPVFCEKFCKCMEEIIKENQK